MYLLSLFLAELSIQSVSVHLVLFLVLVFVTFIVLAVVFVLVLISVLLLAFRLQLKCLAARATRYLTSSMVPNLFTLGASWGFGAPSSLVCTPRFTVLS